MKNLNNSHQKKEYKNLCIIYLGRKGSLPLFTYSIAKEILNNDYDINKLECILSKNNSCKSDFDNLKKDIYYLDTPITLKEVIFKLPIFIIKFIQILKILKKRNINNFLFTIIHPWHPVCMILIKIFIKNSNIIDICHAFIFPIRNIKERIEHVLIKLEYKLANNIVTLSSKTKKDILETYKNKNISSLYHPLYMSYKKNINIKSIHNKIPTFIMFGRLIPYKGLFLLLNSFQKLSDIKNGEVKLIIAGEGVIKDEELKLIKSINEKYNNIEIINQYINEEEMQSIWDKVDICCISYLNSLQSGVIPLAISNAIPSIITPLEALEEQCYTNTDTEIALVAKDVSSEAFLEKMIEILNDDIYKKLSANTIKIQKELSWNGFIVGIKSILINNIKK